MTSRRFRRRVTRVVIPLVGVLETSFRQILAINEKASLRAARDTCRHVIGRRVRGVVSLDFGGFLNTEGFLGLGFILISTLFPSYSHQKKLFGASD